MITQNRKFNCIRGLSNTRECHWIAYSRAYFKEASLLLKSFHNGSHEWFDGKVPLSPIFLRL